MAWYEKAWEYGSTFVGEATGYYDTVRATTGVDPVTGEELTAAERTKHGALAAAGFIPFVGWAGRAFKGGKAIHSTYKGMKATDSALNAYQTTKSLDTLRKAEYGLYGITTANDLGEYVTGKDMFGNELSEERRERSLNEALAFLGGNAASVGLRNVNPTVNFANVNRNGKKPEGHSLLPGEGKVGTYEELIDAGVRGDNITPHHMPSAKYMKTKAGINKNGGISMNMEPPHPGKGGRHRQTEAYGLTGKKLQGYLNLEPRDALARD